MTSEGGRRRVRTRRGMRGPTTTALVAGAGALAVAAVAAGVIALVNDDRALPIVASLGGPEAAPTRIATLSLSLGLVLLLVGGAATFASAAAVEQARTSMLVLGWSQGAGILVVLVARANGIAEVAAVVPLYALAATSVALQAIDLGPPTSTWRRPGAWAAACGIVPWGVIAFAQVGATIVGDGPSLGIRIATLLALAVAVAGWTCGWRQRARTSVVVGMTVGLGVAAYLLLAAI